MTPRRTGQGESESHSTKPARVFTGPVRLYLLARFSGSAAFQIQGVAVGWYIYQLTNSPLQLGLVGLAMFLPTVSLALFAGHAIDRFQRRRVLLSPGRCKPAPPPRSGCSRCSMSATSSGSMR